MICDANVMLMNVVLNSNSSKQEEREQIVWPFHGLIIILVPKNILATPFSPQIYDFSSPIVT